MQFNDDDEKMGSINRDSDVKSQQKRMIESFKKRSSTLTLSKIPESTIKERDASDEENEETEID